MGVKFARAFRAHVVLFTTMPAKSRDVMRLGADEVVVSKNAGAMQRYLNSLDFILDTVAAPHDLDAYLGLLKRDGTLCLVGVPHHPHPSPGVTNLIMKRRRLTGSAIVVPRLRTALAVKTPKMSSPANGPPFPQEAVNALTGVSAGPARAGSALLVTIPGSWDR